MRLLKISVALDMAFIGFDRQKYYFPTTGMIGMILNTIQSDSKNNMILNTI